MSALLNSIDIGLISSLASGEVYFTSSGGRAFEMLSRYIDGIYRNLDFFKIIFLDNFDLYDNFIIPSMSSKLSGAPARFYVIDIQNVQKNISITREALFEKNFCDMAFAAISNLELPLFLSNIMQAFKKVYSDLEIKYEIDIFTSETNDNKTHLFGIAAQILKSSGLSFNEKTSFELDDFLEIKFYMPGGEHGRLNLGFIAFDCGKILFSLTGGLEKIIKEKARSAGGHIPFIINPFQLVVIAISGAGADNIYSVIDSFERRGHSVVRHFLNVPEGSPLREDEFGPLVCRYKEAGACNVLVLPGPSGSSKAMLYRGGNQKICGMDFFQLNTVYLQKDFKGCE